MSGKNKQHGITHSKTMFGSTDVDQGKEYLREFLREHPVSKHAAFLILQEVFISGGGERVYGEATKGTAALEDRMLVHCSKDRCQIALNEWGSSLPSLPSLNADDFSKRHMRDRSRSLSDGQKAKVAKINEERAQKNEPALTADQIEEILNPPMTGGEFLSKFKEIRSRIENHVHPAYDNAMTKGKSIPSGKQFADIVDQIRVALWKGKEIARIETLLKNRESAAKKAALKGKSAPVTKASDKEEPMEADYMPPHLFVWILRTNFFSDELFASSFNNSSNRRIASRARRNAVISSKSSMVCGVAVVFATVSCQNYGSHSLVKNRKKTTAATDCHSFAAHKERFSPAMAVP